MIRRGFVLFIVAATTMSVLVVRPAAAAPAQPIAGATISPTRVEAGSGGHTFTVTYTVGSAPFRGYAGSRIPAGWTAPQRSTASGAGYVSAASSTCNRVAVTGIFGSAPWTVVLEANCKAGNTFTLRYANVTAPTTAAAVRFESGSMVNNSGTITPVEPHPTVTVHPAPAQTLAVSGFPNPTTAGDEGGFSVVGVDRYGNVEAPHAAPLAVRSTDERAVLPSSLDLSTGRASSRATLRTAGTHDLVAVSTAEPTVTGAQVGIAVQAGPAARIELSPASAEVPAGVAQPYSVEAFDAYDNSRGPVSATLGISPDGTCSASDCTATATGAHVVTATAGALTDTAALDVVAADVASFTISGFPSPSTAGSVGRVEVRALDRFGNTATGYAGTVGLSSSDSAATMPPPAALVNGVAHFDVALVTAGVQSLTATDLDMPALTASQADIDVRPGALSRIALAPATTSVVAGGVVEYTATGFDAYGNDVGPISPTLSISPSGTCSGLACSPRRAGAHTVQATVGSVVGTATLDVLQETVTVDPATLPEGTVGDLYSVQLTAPGAVGTSTFTVSGALPAGLTLSADGLLSGTPTSVGSSTFTVTATDENLVSGSRTYTLVVTSVLVASLSTLDFGEVAETASATRTATITNRGGRDVVLSSVSADPGFAAYNLAFGTDTCFTTDPLTPGETCTVAVTFTPPSTGPHTATFTYNYRRDSTNLGVPFALSGVGVSQLSASLSSLSFGEVPETASETRTATITNRGGRDVVLSSVSADPGFAAYNLAFGTDTCFTTDPLTPGETCTVAVAFTPPSTGARSATFTYNFRRDSTNLGVPFALTGTGVPQLSASLSALDFGEVPETASATRTATITNRGGRDVVLSSVSADPGFAAYNLAFGTDTCFTTDPLTPGETCTVAVAFTPPSTGAHSATFTYNFRRDSTNLGVPFALSGVGVSQLSASLSSLSFGEVPETASATRTATITNRGGRDVVLSSVSADPGFAAYNLAFGTDTCFTTDPLTPGETCTVAVAFTPPSTGAHSATFTYNFRRDSTNLGVPFALTGTGVPQLSASLSSLNFGEVPETASETRTATITNRGTRDVALSSVSADPGFAAYNLAFGTDTCFTTDPLTPGETCTVAVTFTPPSTGAHNATFTYNFRRDSTNLGVPFALTGTGVSQLSASLSTLDYGAVALGDNATRTATITNRGTRDVVLSSVSADPGFAAYNLAFGTDTCFTTDPLTPGETCTVAVAFTPPSTGAHTATFTYNYRRDSTNLGVPIALSGTGSDTFTSSASVLDFGDVAQTASRTLTATITNRSSQDVTLSSVSADPGFAAYNLAFGTDTCFTTDPLTPGETCTVAITFTPPSTGAHTATFTYNYRRADSSTAALSFTLNGRGVAQLQASTSALEFGSVATGTSRTLTATVTNRGGQDVTLSSVSADPGFAAYNLAFGTDTCFTTDPLTPGETCTVAITFSPPSTGAHSATFTYNYRRTDGSTVALPFALTGTGR